MQATRAKIILFGDSLTQRNFALEGWGARLADHYSRKADIFNRGYGGYNSRWATHLLPHLFMELETPPDLVVVFFGANDAALLDGPDGRQHVPVEEYKENLGKIVRHIRKIGCRHTLLITPPPVDNDGWTKARMAQEEYGGVDRCFDVTKAYAAACVLAAEEANCPVLDTFTKFSSVKDWETCMFDGVHFNAHGNGLIFDWLSSAIVENFPSLSTEAMAPDFPMNKDVDHLNPASSFGIDD